MTELLTAAQMRAIEQAAIDSGDVTGLELMERAGQGVVEAIWDEWPELAEGEHRAVVLCGPGNNGGDGFVVARLLRQAGWEVRVFLYGSAAKLPVDAKANYDRLSSQIDVVPLTSGWHDQGPAPDLIVDALFGTGLSRGLSDDLLVCLRPLNHGRWVDAEGRPKRPNVVSVDVRSGVCADSGKVICAIPPEIQDPARTLVYCQNRSVTADLTVTFQWAKVGHHTGHGPIGSGALRIMDIGIGQRVLVDVLAKDPSKVVEYLADAPAEGLMQSPAHMRDLLDKTRGHKFTHGHALVLSGGPGQTGAARLAARGALRIGAGLVTIGVPPAAQQEVACQVTAIMLKPVADAAGLSDILSDPRITAICLGPALGLATDKTDLVRATLASGLPCVLDADALTLIARAPALVALLHENCVLTPHEGEFARLFPDLAAKLAAPATRGPAYSKVDAAREAAGRVGCIVLFKGADTVIAAPEGPCRINASTYARAAPWLATAGSGDVLAGFIAGLLARGFPPIDAASTGAWLHTECARHFGPGLIAEDLPEQLPAVLRALSLAKKYSG